MKIPFSTAALCAAFATALLPIAHAAPGDLDPTFGGGDGLLTTDFGSINDYGNSMAVQADGRILVAGDFWNGSNYDSALACYLADGTPDASFGGGDGWLTTDFAGNDDTSASVAVDADGKILVAGRAWIGSGDNFALARYSSDGTPDSSFGSGEGKLTTDFGFGSDFGASVAVQADGKILVAGSASNGNNYDFALARYTVGGILDANFGLAQNGKVTTPFGGGSDHGRSVAVQTDGRILVAGYTWNGSNDDFALARYTADGTLDADFGSGGKLTTDFAGGNDTGVCVAVQADGRILVAGHAQNGGTTDFALARYTATGTPDTSFGAGDGLVTTDFASGYEYGASMAVQADGKILVAGKTWNGSTYDFALARYTADGSPDFSFGGGDGWLTTDFDSDSDVANSVTIQSDGKILVAGYAWSSSNANFALARYLTDAPPVPATPPVVKVQGKKKLVATKASVRLKGTTTGSVTSVAVKIGKKTVQAAGTASWSAKLKLKPGKNKVAVTATGPGGTSAPAKVTVIRQ